jgi:hypothetical protein
MPLAPLPLFAIFQFEPGSLAGVVKLFGLGERGRAEWREFPPGWQCLSETPNLSDFLPAGVCLRAELFVGGGGKSVST